MFIAKYPVTSLLIIGAFLLTLCLLPLLIFKNTVENKIEYWEQYSNFINPAIAFFTLLATIAIAILVYTVDERRVTERAKEELKRDVENKNFQEKLNNDNRQAWALMLKNHEEALRLQNGKNIE